MKRSAPIARRTPLTSSTPLARSSALAPKHTRKPAKRRGSSGVPAKVRAALKVRSGGVCEIQAPGCSMRATEDSHRLKVGMGGRHGAAAVRHHVLSQLLHACHGCHRGLHEAPAAAYWAGRMLREGEDPTAVPVLYRNRWVLLADDGSITDSPKTTADKEAS